QAGAGRGNRGTERDALGERRGAAGGRPSELVAGHGDALRGPGPDPVPVLAGHRPAREGVTGVGHEDGVVAAVALFPLTVRVTVSVVATVSVNSPVTGAVTVSGIVPEPDGGCTVRMSVTNRSQRLIGW